MIQLKERKRERKTGKKKEFAEKNMDHGHHRKQLFLRSSNSFSSSNPSLSSNMLTPFLYSSLIFYYPFIIFTLLLTTIFNFNNLVVESFNLTTITFDQGYNPLFSDFNIHRSSDDTAVTLILNRHSGSGFISSDYYNYGFFSAKIKLPSEYTAGIVVAFYTSNVDAYRKNHDELDFEFLGNIRGKAWRFQTNMYGNGSTSRGREERYRLWFDPSIEFHAYSILWTPTKIIFYIDDIPIREILHKDEMAGDYPSKPMSLYATIWDASSWATNGGRHKVNYKYQPFSTQFKDLALEGCRVDPIQKPSDETNCSEATDDLESADFSTISDEQRGSMKRFRERYMFYSYCYDRVRYPIPPPECVLVESEVAMFRNNGRLRETTRSRLRRRRRNRRQGGGPIRDSGQQAAM